MCPFQVDDTSIEQIVLKGRCNSELRSLNCQHVDAVAAEMMDIWKGGKRLCIKRDPDYSLYNSEDSVCRVAIPSGYQRCGSSTRAVCRKAAAQCPITYLQKLPSADEANGG